MLCFLLATVVGLATGQWGGGFADPGNTGPSAPPPPDQHPADRVLMRDVQVLTLRHGHWTAGRRGSPVLQLQQVGGTAQGNFEFLAGNQL